MKTSSKSLKTMPMQANQKPAAKPSKKMKKGRKK